VNYDGPNILDSEVQPVPSISGFREKGLPSWSVSPGETTGRPRLGSKVCTARRQGPNSGRAQILPRFRFSNAYNSFGPSGPR